MEEIQPAHVLPASGLTRAIEAIIAAGGSDGAEAARVASSLVESNLRGHDSHGVGMVPRYVDALTDGGLEVNRQLQVALDAGSLLRVDGQRGYGQVIGEAAMRMAIDRAAQTGVCILALANSHHLGRIGEYAEMAVDAGFVVLCFVNVLSRPIVAPWAGSDGRFGTNPCCIGIPVAGEPPFILDFATSIVAQGKIRVAYNRNEAVRPGLLLDDAGHPTTDPRFGVLPPLGAILPFGEHKGYGLAIACELLGGALTGSGTEHGVPRGDRRIVNGMLAIVIDPARAGSSAFGAETSAFLQWLRGSPAAEGWDRIRLAGDPERESRADRLAHGIPIDATTWRSIVDAAERLGLSAASVESTARQA